MSKSTILKMLESLTEEELTTILVDYLSPAKTVPAPKPKPLLQKEPAKQPNSGNTPFYKCVPTMESFPTIAAVAERVGATSKTVRQQINRKGYYSSASDPNKKYYKVVDPKANKHPVPGPKRKKAPRTSKKVFVNGVACPSIMEASRRTGFDFRNISRALLNGNGKTVIHGVSFAYGPEKPQDTPDTVETLFTV